jgi:hypothetical protein
MAYQETVTTGYGTQVKQSFKKIATGFTLFLGATAMLWWNEGNSVKTADMLEEAQGVCVEMENPNKKDASLEGQLVCGTAMTATTDLLTDKDFGFSVNAISMKRSVEYYQWDEKRTEETKQKLDGSEKKVVTYDYNLKWSSSPIGSKHFKEHSTHVNVVLAEFEDDEQWAEHVSFGAYNLNNSLIHSINAYEPLRPDMSDDMLRVLDKTIQASYERHYTKKEGLNSNDYNFVHVSDGQLYLGLDPNDSKVGDVRINFEKVAPANEVTVVAVVDGDGFKPFKAKNGYTLEKLVMGRKDMNQFFENEQETNTFNTWAYRILGIVMVIGALKLIFGFVVTLTRIVPFLSTIVGWGVGVICTVLGVVWSLFVIAVAWLFYRPIVGIALLAIAGILVWIFALGGKNKLKQFAVNQQQIK